MKHVIHFHNMCEDAYKEKHADFARKLKKVLDEMPLFSFPNKSKVSLKVKKHHILQSLQNTWLRAALQELGFVIEYALDEWKRHKKRGQNTKSVDFAIKIGDRMCLIEVEFGNSSRLDSDFLKLLDAHNWGHLEFGIIILANKAMTNEMTGGAADYEQALSHLAGGNAKTYQQSLMIVGLDKTSANVVDMSKSKILNPQLLSGNSKQYVLDYVIAQYRAGVPVEYLDIPPYSAPEIKALNVKQ